MSTQCVVCSALDGFHGDDLIELKKALNGAVAKTDIADGLSLFGYPVSEAGVRRHLKNHRGNK